jgi:hypothetical protein
MSHHQTSLDLPPCKEGQIDSHSGRRCFPLGIDEDPNWLSEFHCYVRSDLVEVFRASQDDVRARNNSIAYQQVGLRCRFCADITPSARAGRSSAFPSTQRQLYQSFTMMLRDHFPNCDAMPNDVLETFNLLKDKPAQGATDSKVSEALRHVPCRKVALHCFLTIAFFFRRDIGSTRPPRLECKIRRMDS